MNRFRHGRLSLVIAILLAWMLAPMSESAASENTPMHPGVLAHKLDRLANTGRVLYIAAHPDDENSRLLAYLANARHLTVAYLSLTRGNGGQNLIGAEQGDLLGVIRTQELFAARRIDGAYQLFGNLSDFGYSKSAAETLAAWGREKALADVVRVIRAFQPDVMITRFDEQPPNHGHHMASAILAREAFFAAADPHRFPEQLQDGITPWKTDRLLYNVWPAREKPANGLDLDVGGYDARLGLSYGELAAQSRSQHKSQGFGVLGQRGPLPESFVPVAGTLPKHDILEGIPLSWKRFGKRGAALAKALDEARATLDRDAPEQVLPALAQAHRQLDALPPGPRSDGARATLNTLMAAAAGLFARATAETPAAIPGTSLPVQVELLMRRPAQMQLQRIVFTDTEALQINSRLALDDKQQFAGKIAIPANAPVTWPYWLRPECGSGQSSGCRTDAVIEPEGPQPLVVHVDIEITGRPVRLDLPVQYVWADRVLGERMRAVTIVPPVTITPARTAMLLPNGQSAHVGLTVRGWQDRFSGTVRLPLPPGWHARPAEIAVMLSKAGDEKTVHFEVQAPPRSHAERVAPEVVVNGKSWSFREDRIDYAHIPVQSVIRQAVIRLVPLSIHLPSGLVGYVEGSGDTVMTDLSDIGVNIQPIDETTLQSGDLTGYSAIVFGIRAFNTRPVLRMVHQKLMRYVEQGGTVIVQYNTQNRWSTLDMEIGPYPLTIGQGRVTDQNAEMTPVNSADKVLTTPNRLEPGDFAGWVQERGLYFAENWDKRYTPVFRVADPGEEPLLGSLLVAKFGKGRFVYTGLSFFRQLPEGVPGAYRLLANLIDGK